MQMTDYRDGFKHGYDAGYKAAKEQVVSWLQFQAQIMCESGWSNMSMALTHPTESACTEALIQALERRS